MAAQLGVFYLPSKGFHHFYTYLVSISFQRVLVGLYPKIEAMKSLQFWLNIMEKATIPMSWLFSNSIKFKTLSLMNAALKKLAGSKVICNSTGRKEIRSGCLFYSGVHALLSAFNSYYLSPVLTSVGLTSSLQQTLINATQQMLSWFPSLYFATFPNKLGPRVLFLGSCVGRRRRSGRPLSILPGYNFGINGNLGLYIAETLPFHLRMRGQAFFQLFSTCFTLVSTYAFPIVLQNMAWKFYFIFIPWVAIKFIVVYFVYPETKGYALEEIALNFDGEDTIPFGGHGLANRRRLVLNPPKSSTTSPLVLKANFVMMLCTDFGIFHS
ncbi:Major facilitator superfamily domain general substrate transporter [Penicillium canescens]|nr:Major facilitator superfamily domain general substrate transporter [Penicillium canescens]